jgi:hypothetical protein
VDKRTTHFAIAAVASIGAAVGLWSAYDFYFNQQSGWRCFQEQHDPHRETELFVSCIEEKTRWDMARNPHLYVSARGDNIDPAQVNFEFLGVDVEEGGLPIYRFRYLLSGEAFCRYYIPDEYGQYFVQGAYAEASTPNPC